MQIDLAEGHIKIAIIKQLMKNGLLDDAVLINEMVVSDWTRRVDLALASGRLTAFEVKSDLDSLTRLDGQLETYRKNFDKVVVVTTQRHLSAVLVRAPIGVAVWCALPRAGGCELKIVRRGRESLVRDEFSLCAFLRKSELISLLRKTVADDITRESRVELTKRASSISRVDLRTHVVTAIKKRYRDTFQEFLEHCSSSINVDDLAFLSKSKNARRQFDALRVQTPKHDDFSGRVNAVPLKLSSELTQGDAMQFPKYVLARRRLIA